MRIAIFLLMATIAGAQMPKDMTKDRVLAGLRFEAKKHHLRWYVFCVPETSGNVYQADAVEESEPEGAIYIEDGRKPSWAKRGNTAIEAAYSLYLALAKNGDLYT